MSESTKVILWRHGITDYNATGRFQGQLDIELNETGVAQAKLAAPKLAALKPDFIYASTLKRAQRTAQELAKLCDLEINFDPRLKEINVGSWEGMEIEQAKRQDPAFAQAMIDHVDHRRSPEGETAVETGQRVGQAVAEIALRHPGKLTIITSHGLAIRMATAYLMGWDYRTSIDLSGMKNCAWTQLTLTDDWWRLNCWNQQAN